MARSPVRRGQLIAPFGVGSMVVVRNGVSVMAAGLDHWYKREDGVLADQREYAVEEWRLSRQLRVAEFRAPPDFRTPGRDVPNAGMTVPFVRFPLYHVCPNNACNLMRPSTLVERTSPRCRACNRMMSQVPLVTICKNGHIQDFPWREWVHAQVTPECEKDLRFVATGGSTLAAQKVKCDCGRERSLNGVTFDGVLAKTLEEGGVYSCPGKRPWLGHLEGEACGERVVVALRSASNAYFAQTQSAIFIPRGGNEVPQELIEILESPALNQFIQTFGESLDIQLLRNSKIRELSELLRDYSDADVRLGIRYLLSEDEPENSEPKDEVDFRREEFNVLRRPRKDNELKIRVPDITSYGAEVTSFFERVTLVEKLRETRALYGFTRVVSESERNQDSLKSQLRRPTDRRTWLPAYAVFGEGIFLEFREEALKGWEARNKKALRVRMEDLGERHRQHRKALNLSEKPISARALLVHTLAHLLINQLVFDCGYSAASLRERLYVSDDENSPMAALLVYTASGDAEGTMGGLVRMGKPGLLEPVIRKAVEGATWCSADPVCMEAARGGQGPSGLNLAACHSCALVPETSCEQFNQGLDRGTVIGDFREDLGGFFGSIVDLG